MSLMFSLMFLPLGIIAFMFGPTFLIDRYEKAREFYLNFAMMIMGPTAFVLDNKRLFFRKLSRAGRDTLKFEHNGERRDLFDDGGFLGRMRGQPTAFAIAGEWGIPVNPLYMFADQIYGKTNEKIDTAGERFISKIGVEDGIHAVDPRPLRYLVATSADDKKAQTITEYIEMAFSRYDKRSVGQMMVLVFALGIGMGGTYLMMTSGGGGGGSGGSGLPSPPGGGIVPTVIIPMVGLALPSFRAIKRRLKQLLWGAVLAGFGGMIIVGFGPWTFISAIVFFVVGVTLLPAFGYLNLLKFGGRTIGKILLKLTISTFENPLLCQLNRSEFDLIDVESDVVTNADPAYVSTFFSTKSIYLGVDIDSESFGDYTDVEQFEATPVVDTVELTAFNRQQSIANAEDIAVQHAKDSLWVNVRNIILPLQSAGGVMETDDLTELAERKHAGNSSGLSSLQLLLGIPLMFILGVISTLLISMVTGGFG